MTSTGKCKVMRKYIIFAAMVADVGYGSRSLKVTLV